MGEAPWFTPLLLFLSLSWCFGNRICNLFSTSFVNLFCNLFWQLIFNSYCQLILSTYCATYFVNLFFWTYTILLESQLFFWIRFDLQLSQLTSIKMVWTASIQIITQSKKGLFKNDVTQIWPKIDLFTTLCHAKWLLYLKPSVTKVLCRHI